MIRKDESMSSKELLIQQICELDETANPRFLGLQSEEELQAYYDCLAELGKSEAIAHHAD